MQPTNVPRLGRGSGSSIAGTEALPRGVAEHLRGMLHLRRVLHLHGVLHLCRVLHAA